MNRIILIVASWLRRFTSTGATSCPNPIQCPVCVVINHDDSIIVMDWCKHCGSDIYNVPNMMAWFNRYGKYACPDNGYRAHVPLLYTQGIKELARQRTRHKG